MSRESTQNALNELHAVIGGANLMTGLKERFGVRSFHQLADNKMEQAEAWAKRKLAAHVTSSTGGSGKIDTAAIYARFNKRKAGAPVKPMADD